MLPLATTTWDQKEYDALQTVIDSDMFSMGQKVAEFEGAFAEFIGSQHCVMVNSGSSANLIAIAALFYTKDNALKPGDEVIVPAVSWSTTYYPLYQYGLKIKFVDVCQETLNIDLDQLELAISDKTRAIFSVNLLGNPVDYQRVQSLIEDKDIILVEDNCESMGATLHGKQAGTYGVMGTFSSFFSHHISTMEGGMVVTDDEELYHIMLSLRSHGWTRHLPKQNHVSDKSDNDFYESFRFVLPGYNLRPLEMSGALGLMQLEKLPSIITGRQENAKSFTKLFSDIPGVTIQHETGESSWFGFALIFEDGKEKRDEIVSLFEKHNIACRPIVAGNFVRNPVVEYFDYSVHGELKNSDTLSDSGLFIGNHHYDIKKQLGEVASIIKIALCI
ncbi:DegT/DnrJ/EryC1/StrS family aminotransferase [Parendozoicomonas sp. Alg238-R29]|uniref:DegT/DnrJ/EryC1/StrS family aminotransferase n=1 Tax=Parendozoicomonas sp. Alg238-R29 TaxID=2993446 RepID=UPI00248EE38F|nr:DegT/DnrJ/EryC1/StrS family aminotransferase [Parendozoicomonas sp. Alg238-R29]